MKYIIKSTIGYIKSYFYPTISETPNSPPTFNLTLEQLREAEAEVNQNQKFNFTPEQMKDIKQKLDNGETLDQETKDKLDEDFKNILGLENYAEFQADMQQIHADMENELQELLNNLDLFI